MPETQSFAISLSARDPNARLFVLTGVVEARGLSDPFDNDHLQHTTMQYNLTSLHLLPPLPPGLTTVTAAVGLASLNNDDAADEWTWAIDRVEATLELPLPAPSLMLIVDLAARGGPDGNNVEDNVVIAKLAYHVTVMLRERP
jgi:hypothetical protein